MAMEEWSTVEKLELALIAAKTGNQNWVTVARSMASWSKTQTNLK